MMSRPTSASAALLAAFWSETSGAREGCQSHAQVTGRASGVVLHAVVRLSSLEIAYK
jgi:hypothetical protein